MPPRKPGGKYKGKCGRQKGDDLLAQEAAQKQFNEVLQRNAKQEEDRRKRELALKAGLQTADEERKMAKRQKALNLLSSSKKGDVRKWFKIWTQGVKAAKRNKVLMDRTLRWQWGCNCEQPDCSCYDSCGAFLALRCKAFELPSDAKREEEPPRLLDITNGPFSSSRPGSAPSPARPKPLMSLQARPQSAVQQHQPDLKHARAMPFSSFDARQEEFLGGASQPRPGSAPTRVVRPIIYSLLERPGSAVRHEQFHAATMLSAQLPFDVEREVALPSNAKLRGSTSEPFLPPRPGSAAALSRVAPTRSASAAAAAQQQQEQHRRQQQQQQASRVALKRPGSAAAPSRPAPKPSATLQPLLTAPLNDDWVGENAKNVQHYNTGLQCSLNKEFMRVSFVEKSDDRWNEPHLQLEKNATVRRPFDASTLRKEKHKAPERITFLSPLQPGQRLRVERVGGQSFEDVAARARKQEERYGVKDEATAFAQTQWMTPLSARFAHKANIGGPIGWLLGHIEGEPTKLGWFPEEILKHPLRPPPTYSEGVRVDLF